MYSLRNNLLPIACYSRTSPLLTTSTRRALRVTPSDSESLQNGPNASADSADSSSKPIGLNHPASELKDQDAKTPEQHPEMKEPELHNSSAQSSPGGDPHPAKQPDPQEQPSRSTGIGG